MSLRARVTLFGAGIVLLTVLLFSLLLYLLVARGIAGQQNQALALRAQQAAGYLNLAPAQEFRGQRSLVPINLSTGADTFIELLDAAGNPTWSSGEINGVRPEVPGGLLESASDKGHALATIAAQQGVELRLYVLPWSRPELDLNGYVVAGQPARGLKSSLNGLRTFLSITALLCLLAALGASWFVLGRALRPLKQMTLEVDAIGSTQDLGRRLPPVRGNDEIGLLTRGFNGMLQRVQEAYDNVTSALNAQKRFVADASHELRTPLTTIRSNAGFLLQRPDAESADREAALQDIAEESNRMSRLVQDLLTLARADAGHQIDLAPLDLGLIVRDVARKAQNLHHERTIKAEGEAALVVQGNAGALLQLLWILVDNAVRSTGPGGSVVLRLAHQRGTAMLSVTDNGTGISVVERSRIFERFYQADASRSSGGAGLGLAIARWITDQHHGRIAVTSNAGPGATFSVELPESLTTFS